MSELIRKAILPSYGCITSGITVLRNKNSGHVWVATQTDEELQLRKSVMEKIEIIGDLESKEQS